MFNLRRKNSTRVNLIFYSIYHKTENKTPPISLGGFFMIVPVSRSSASRKHKDSRWPKNVEYFWKPGIYWACFPKRMWHQEVRILSMIHFISPEKNNGTCSQRWAWSKLFRWWLWLLWILITREKVSVIAGKSSVPD